MNEGDCLPELDLVKQLHIQETADIDQLRRLCQDWEFNQEETNSKT